MDGLRGARRGHLRAPALQTRRSRCAASRRCSPARCRRARRRRRMHRDRHRRADARRRRRGRHGRRDRPRRRLRQRPIVQIMTPVDPRQNVGRRGADIAHGRRVLAPGDVLTPSRVGALAAIGTARRRRLRPPASSRSSRPATRSSSPASRWGRRRSTTSTGSRSPRSSADHGGSAAWRCRRRPTRSTRSIDAVATPRSGRHRWSSPAAARSANAT